MRAVSSLVVNAAAGSETGRRYRENFDVAHLGVDPLLAVVADGMGDGPGSRMAGRTAVETLVERFAKNVGIAEIQDAIASACAVVRDYGQEIGGLAGCTLTALVETAEGHWIAQLGDSRVYRLRARLLELLTVDHTMAWLGAVHGWYPFDSAQASAARYQLTRYVGHFRIPEPDLMRVELQPGDAFLLCTDGIAEQVSYHQIADVLGRRESPQTMVESLLAAAESAGGNDNATAIVVTIQ
jgi:serine/threonine protein phosphatase PrpC